MPLEAVSFAMSEFLEVAFHNILYARNVYPSAAFEKRKKYNVPVWKCLHPGVSSYIANCVSTIHKLLLKSQVHKVTLNVLDASNKPFEKFVFETRLQNRPSANEEDIAILLNTIEQAFRGFILRISATNQLMKAQGTTAGCCFSIHIQTAESTAAEMNVSDDIEQQRFPWIEVDNTTRDVDSNSHIIPLKAIDIPECQVQFYAIEDDTGMH